MAKLKTHKSTVKRFKITKKGKLTFNAPAWNHLKSRKNARVKYRKNVSRTLDKTTVRALKKAVPGVSNS